MFLVIVLSVAARAWLLWKRPLWFDELFTIWAARLPFAALISVLRSDSGPPLFYVLEKPFLSLGERFLSSDLVARALPFGSTLAVFVGARAIPTPSSRRRFLLLCAASPLLLLYSAEARAYALVALLGLSLFLLSLVGRERPGLFAAIFLLTAAILYSHYLGIFVVGALTIVAAAEKRGRSALALLAGAALFAFWIPVMVRQPREAVAWMHEPAFELFAGTLSSLGGAGDIPHPFGPSLPAPLVAMGIALAITSAFTLARQWRSDAAARRGAAFLVLFFGGVVFASFARPVAFAGRTEMAILPVWLWIVAVASERSRVLRIVSLVVVVVALVSSAVLLAAPRGPTASSRVLASIEQAARPGDAVIAGAHFYLPARLAADRGRLTIPVYPFPLEQKEHPGWSHSVRLRPEDLVAVADVLDRTESRGRVFLVMPTSYAIALEKTLRRRGVTTVVLRRTEIVVLIWSRNSES